MLIAARRSPREAFLGIDADASRMREASARAARASTGGGLPNAWYVVSAAETLPTVLAGRVDELRLVLPWGSLLRGALGPEPWFAAAARDLLRHDGELILLVSVAPRDGVPGVPVLGERALTELVDRYRRSGWCSIEARPATPDDVRVSGSSWAKRLGIPARRPASFLRLVPCAAQPRISRA